MIRTAEFLSLLLATWVCGLSAFGAERPRHESRRSHHGRGPIFSLHCPHRSPLAPTCYELARITYPSQFADHPIHPLDGVSLLPRLQGKTADDVRTLYFEHEGGRAIREGDWKLVSNAKGLNKPEEGGWSIATAWERSWPAAWHHAHATRTNTVGRFTIYDSWWSMKCSA